MIKFTKNMMIQALDATPAPAVVIDAHKDGWPVVYLNSAVEILLGRTAAELVGESFQELLVEGALPDADALPATGAAERQKWRTRDGISVWLDVRWSPLVDRAGRPGLWLLSVIDEAQTDRGGQSQATARLRDELVDARRQLKSLQRVDPVTGLASASVFREVLERDWAIARRVQRPIAVIVFAVDCLDAYRDTYGRHATDSLLRKIGHALGGSLRRAGDFSARLAGDRFAVLIGDAEPEQADALARRIAAKVRNLAIHHPRSTTARFVTVSYAAVSEVPAWTRASVMLVDEAVSRLGGDAEATGAVASDRVSDAQSIS